MFKMFHNGKEPNMRETEEWGNPDKIKEVLSLLEFDLDNAPEWFLSEDDLELSEEDTAEFLAERRKEKPEVHGRTERHERVVLLKDREDERSFREIAGKDKERLRKEGDKEPKIALVDRDRNVRGAAPLHMYLEKTGLDRILEQIDSGELSITYSGLPEAMYYNVEDGMDRGRNAWAGTINGEAEISVNRNMDLTIANFVLCDNVHVYENALSPEIEAKITEAREERIDQQIGNDYYTGDYRGWDDPDYEPEDELMHEYGS